MCSISLFGLLIVVSVVFYNTANMLVKKIFSLESLRDVYYDRMTTQAAQIKLIRCELETMAADINSVDYFAKDAFSGRIDILLWFLSVRANIDEEVIDVVPEPGSLDDDHDPDDDN